MSTNKKQASSKEQKSTAAGSKSKMSDFGSMLSAMTSSVPKKSVTLPEDPKTQKGSFAGRKDAKEKFSVKRGAISDVSAKMKEHRNKLAEKRRTKSAAKRSIDQTDAVELTEEEKKALDKKMKKQRKAKKILLEKDHTTPQFDDKEKKLVKTATKGVVALFNAVSEQQKKIEEIERNLTLRADEKDELTRNEAEMGFLQVLQEKTKKANSLKKESDDDSSSESSSESEEEKANAPAKGQSNWKVLDDNYMLKNKMKQYDESSDSDDSEE